MPFDFLLWNCLRAGKTSFSEEGKTAHLRPGNDECVLAFGIDNQSFRACFKTQKACDALFFCKRNDGPVVLLLVELKGSDIDTAAEQLGETLQAIRGSLTRQPSFRQQAEFRAVVVTHGPGPKQDKALKKRFENRHRVPLEVSRSGDLRDFV